MRLDCVDPGEAAKGGWLTRDTQYTLLGVIAVPGRAVSFRVMSNDGRTPVVAPSTCFAAPVQPVPATWAARVSKGGVLEVAPAAWLADGFWERFFDRDAEADATFWREFAILDGRP